MTEMEKIAAAFRVGLIPSVAKKTAWPKMTDASRASYVEATETAIHQILAPVVKEALSEKTLHLQTALDEVCRVAQAAVHALRSYEHGNSSPELAQEIIAALEAALKLARGEQS